MKQNRIKTYVIGAGTCLLLALASLAWGEGSVSSATLSSRTVRRTTITWTASTNAWVSASNTTYGISGEILRIVIPANATTNEITVTVKDDNGIDLLFGDGASISNALTHLHNTNYPIAVDGYLITAVTNAAVSGTGSVILYHR